MAGRPSRKVVPQLDRVVGVVEDQQPALVGLAPAQCVAGGLGSLGHVVTDAQAQSDRQVRHGAVQQLGLLGGDPPDDVVVGHVAVGVLDGELCLPDAAEAVQGGLRHDRLGAAAFADELLAQALQHLAAPGERRVPGRQVEHRRLTPGVAGAAHGAGGLRRLPWPVEGAQERGHGLLLLQADQVQRRRVGVRHGQPDVGDADGDELPARLRELDARHGLPDLTGLRRTEVGGRQERQDAGGVVDRALGALLVLAGQGVRMDPQADADEDRLDPVVPEPVLRHVTDVDVHEGRRAPAPEQVAVVLPGLFLHGGQAAHLTVGDHVREPLVGGQQ